MNPERKAQLIRAYRAAAIASTDAMIAAHAAITTSALDHIAALPEDEKRSACSHISMLLDTNNRTSDIHADLFRQIKACDVRLSRFHIWGDYGTPAWNDLLNTIEAESSQTSLDFEIELGRPL